MKQNFKKSNSWMRGVTFPLLRAWTYCWPLVILISQS
jgi:hypothetical protein